MFNMFFIVFYTYCNSYLIFSETFLKITIRPFCQFVEIVGFGIFMLYKVR